MRITLRTKIVAASIVALVVGGAAVAASGPKVRQTTRVHVAPICVNKSIRLHPNQAFWTKTWAPGAIRSVARGQNCIRGEQRHLLLQLVRRPGAAGKPGVPGPGGIQGIQGPAGPQGSKGDTGAAGKDGLGNAVIFACVSSGGSLQLDVNGKPCDNQGHMPLKLVVIQP